MTHNLADLDTVQARLEDELTLRLDSESPLDAVGRSLALQISKETGLQPADVWDETSYAYYYDYQQELASRHVRLRVKDTRQSQESRCTLIAKWPVEYISPGREVSLEIISWLRSGITPSVAADLLPNLLPTRVAGSQIGLRLEHLECVLRLRQTRQILRYEIGNASLHAVLDDVARLDERDADPPIERYLDVEFPFSRFTAGEAGLLERLVVALEVASGGAFSKEGKVQGKLLRA